MWNDILRFLCYLLFKIARLFAEVGIRGQGRLRRLNPEPPTSGFSRILVGTGAESGILMSIMTDVRIEPATLEDLDPLVDLVMGLFSLEEEFEPDRDRQERGLRLILEQPNRGRIFVLRNDHMIFGMVNLLFTLSTAEGGFVIQMEDLVVHPDHRGQGYGSQLLDRAVEFAKEKKFLRLTLLTDKIGADSQRLFQKHGFRFLQMIPMRLKLD